MKKRIVFSLLIIAVGVVLFLHFPAKTVNPPNHQIQPQQQTATGTRSQEVSQQWHAYFSPKGGCTQAIVDTLNQAKTSVLVQAYSFTSYPIANALVATHNRRVKVEAILDKSQLHGKGGKIDLLAQSGIPVSIDAVHAIAHNKVMIIDGTTVITGSFNFTTAAENSNAENLLIVQDEKLAAEYTANWNKHREHSKIYQI